MEARFVRVVFYLFYVDVREISHGGWVRRRDAVLRQKMAASHCTEASGKSETVQGKEHQPYTVV